MTSSGETPSVPRPVVEVRKFSRRFGSSVVLEDLDLTLAPGEFVALLGRSGSGKTTLLRALARLDPVLEGSVRTPERRATVFQEARLLPWRRVWRNVVIGLRTPDARAKALAALDEVGLSHRIDAWPATLSGGEAQRTALARALVREPELLLLDEPFAALDALTRIKMHALVQGLWRTHKPAVLLVTHDVDEAVLLADRVLVLEDGHIAADERVELERPRMAADRGFQALRRRLLERLGVETAEPGAAEPRIALVHPAREAFG